MEQEELDRLNHFLISTTTVSELSTTLSKITEEVGKCHRQGVLLAPLANLQKILSELNEWTADIEIDDLHSQTLSSLSTSLLCCRLLSTYLQSDIQKNAPAFRTHVDLLARLRWHRLARIVQRQASILSSLREIGEYKHTMLQKVSLDAPQLRKDLRRVQQDADRHVRVSSMLRPQDTDINHFLDKVCYRTFTNTKEEPRIHFSIRFRASDSRRSKRIDRRLQHEAKSIRNECSGLVFCSSEGNKERIIARLEVAAPNGSNRRLEYRDQIWEFLIEKVGFMVMRLKKTEEDRRFTECDDAFALLESYHSTSQPEPDFAQALTKLWQDPHMVKLMESDRAHEFLCNGHGYVTQYFFSSIDRITKPKWEPSNEDIAKIRIKLYKGLQTTRFPIGHINVQLVEVGYTQGERRKWIHQLAEPTINVFVWDLTNYDQVLYDTEDPTLNRLREAKVLFDSIVNSRWFQQTATMLVLNNFDDFQRKLPTSPLKTYCPGYDGHSPAMAVRFLLNEFLSVRRENQSVYPVLVQREGTSCVGTIHEIIQQIMLGRVAGKSVQGLRRRYLQVEMPSSKRG